jgi:KDO2-lipid IV(A) lauroyltransferase
MAVSLYDVLQYGAIRTITAVAQALPYGVAVGFARRLADLAYLLDGRHRKVAMSNLTMAFGTEKDEREIRRITRGVYRHLFMSAVELLLVRRRLRQENWRDHIVLNNEEGVMAAREQGKGIIFLTGHVGNWELMGVALSGFWIRLSSVARPLGNPLLDRYVMGFRKSFGQNIIEKKGALRAMSRTLRNGGAAVFVADQNVRHSGIFVDFFGKPASTSTGFALLARQFGCPVVTAFCRRVGTYRFEVDYGDPIYPDPGLTRDEDLERIVTVCTSRLEETIRKAPDQWLWLHRRWKTRPRTEESGVEGRVALA